MECKKIYYFYLFSQNYKNAKSLDEIISYSKTSISCIFHGIRELSMRKTLNLSM